MSKGVELGITVFLAIVMIFIGIIWFARLMKNAQNAKKMEIKDADAVLLILQTVFFALNLNILFMLPDPFLTQIGLFIWGNCFVASILCYILLRRIRKVDQEIMQNANSKNDTGDEREERCIPVNIRYVKKPQLPVADCWGLSRGSAVICVPRCLDALLEWISAYDDNEYNRELLSRLCDAVILDAIVDRDDNIRLSNSYRLIAKDGTVSHLLKYFHLTCTPHRTRRMLVAGFVGVTASSTESIEELVSEVPVAHNLDELFSSLVKPY